MANFGKNYIFNGLGTLTIGADVAGPCFLAGHITIPTLSNGGGISACLVTIAQNGSTIYTGQAGAEGFYVTLTCAVGDSLTIVFSSAAAADQGKNVIKAMVSFAGGE